MVAVVSRWYCSVRAVHFTIGPPVWNPSYALPPAAARSSAGSAHLRRGMSPVLCQPCFAPECGEGSSIRLPMQTNPKANEDQRMEKRNCEGQRVSTGTPGGHGQHCSNHLVCQFGCGGLNSLTCGAVSASNLGFCLDHLCPAALRAASSAASRSAFRCWRCSRNLVNLGAGLAQLVAYSVARSSAIGDRLLRGFHRAFGCARGACRVRSADPGPGSGRPQPARRKGSSWGWRRRA